MRTYKVKSIDGESYLTLDNPYDLYYDEERYLYWDIINPPIPLSINVPDETYITEDNIEFKWQGRMRFNHKPENPNNWFFLSFNSDALTPEEWEMQGYDIRLVAVLNERIVN